MLSSLPEQDDCRTPQDPIREQPEAAKQVVGVARPGILKTATANGLLRGGPDFVCVRIVDRQLVRGLVLPPAFAVHALEEHLLVLERMHLQPSCCQPADTRSRGT